MSLQNELGGDSLFNFEWDIFEHSIEWAQQQQSFDWEPIPADPYLSPESLFSTSPSPSTPDGSTFSGYESLERRSRSPKSEFSSTHHQPVAKKSRTTRCQSPESRAKRRNQNRQAQRAFRGRRQQHIEEVELELKALMSKFDGLQEKYANLNVLYLDLLRQKGGEGNAVSEEQGVTEAFRLDWRSDTSGEIEFGKEIDVADCLFGAGSLLGSAGTKFVLPLQ